MIISKGQLILEKIRNYITFTNANCIDFDRGVILSTVLIKI